MAIFKTTVTITVMLEAPSSREAAEMVAEAGLQGLAYEITDGDWIGKVDDGEPVEVPADQVKAELEAIGNDGSFFGEGE